MIKLVVKLASLLLAFSAMAFLFTGPISVAQDSKTPAVLPAPSSGKAIVCIYRMYRFTGSSSHDELYVNGTHLAKLLNGEYAFMEVPPGTVVISGLPKEYYGSIIMSAGAAANRPGRKKTSGPGLRRRRAKPITSNGPPGPLQLGSRLRLSTDFSHDSVYSCRAFACAETPAWMGPALSAVPYCRQFVLCGRPRPGLISNCHA